MISQVLLWFKGDKTFLFQDTVHRLQGFFVPVLCPAAGVAEIDGDFLPGLEEEMTLFQDQADGDVFDTVDDFVLFDCYQTYLWFFCTAKSISDRLKSMDSMHFLRYDRLKMKNIRSCSLMNPGRKSEEIYMKTAGTHGRSISAD